MTLSIYDIVHWLGNQEFFGMNVDLCLSFFPHAVYRNYVIKMTSVKDYLGKEGGMEDEEGGVGGSGSYKHGTRKPVSYVCKVEEGWCERMRVTS